MLAPLILLASLLPTSRTLPYQNYAVPVERRVADLLGRLTLKERIRQLTMLGTEELHIQNGKVPESDLQKLFGNDSVGMLHADFDADAQSEDNPQKGQ